MTRHTGLLDAAPTQNNDQVPRVAFKVSSSTFDFDIPGGGG
ncbi:MAG TPA: hypothetical protein VGM84_17365 [Steroidobacteraceae bacterium]